MRFYTVDECGDWLSGRGRSKPDQDKGLETVRFEYPKKPHSMFVAARWFAQSFMLRNSVLLWITEWGIWPSSENWHLYYKLRHTYGDLRLLREAPGHLFLAHEAEDLATFFEVAMLNGWGGYLLSQASEVDVFFSHDEYMDFFVGSAELVVKVRQFWESQQANQL